MEEERYCPFCGYKTMQAPTLYDPDDEMGLMVWTCSECMGSVDFVDETKL
jgi:hypothetical protein